MIRLVLPLLLLPTVATAQVDPELEVLAADAAVQEHCAEMSASAEDYSTREAVINKAKGRINTAYEETSLAFLLYWRGVLSQCLDQQRPAARDLTTFVQSALNDQRFSAMVRDARRRLKQLGEQPELTESQRQEAASAASATAGASIANASTYRVARFVRRVPFVLVGATGLFEKVGRFNYAGAGVDLSVGIKGPLRIEGGARLAWGIARDADPNADSLLEGSERLSAVPTVLVTGLLGVGLEFELGVRPRFGAYLQLAPHRAKPAEEEEAVAPLPFEAPPVLPGFLLHAGLDLPVSSAPLAFRLFVEGGTLWNQVDFRGGAGLVVGISKPKRR